MYVVIFVLALIFVIMFHEFGHFATAKLFHMKVTQFFLGFGPKIWSFRKGETEYGVKGIPAGGYVKIVGMSSFEEVSEEDRGRTFHEQPAWQRAIVLVAGSFTHFLVAGVLLVAALGFVGYPIATNGIGEAVAGSPARAAGLAPGDRIVAVDGQATGDFDAVRQAVTARPSDDVILTVEHAGERREVAVTIGEQTVEGRTVGLLGVRPAVEVFRESFPDAVKGVFVGDFSIPRLTGLTLSGLVQAFSPTGLSRWFGEIGSQGPRDPNGPISLVGVGQVVNTLGNQGDIFAVLGFLAQLNIVLGTLNMLPLPPLDGGHLATLLVEEGVNGVRRRRGREDRWRLDPAILTPIALAVILFFSVVSLTALYIDLVKPASDLIQ